MRFIDLERSDKLLRSTCKPGPCLSIIFFIIVYLLKIYKIEVFPFLSLYSWSKIWICEKIMDVALKNNISDVKEILFSSVRCQESYIKH